MSFGLLKRVSVRLSLWYTLLFAASTAVVLVLVYYLVAQELERKEEEVIRARAKEYASLFQTRGYAERSQELSGLHCTPLRLEMSFLFGLDEGRAEAGR